MVYRLVSRPQFVGQPVVVAGIGIAVETRAVGRGDWCPFFEDIAGDASFNGVFVDGAGFQQFRLAQALAVEGADDAIAEVLA